MAQAQIKIEGDSIQFITSDGFKTDTVLASSISSYQIDTNRKIVTVRTSIDDVKLDYKYVNRTDYPTFDDFAQEVTNLSGGATIVETVGSGTTTTGTYAADGTTTIAFEIRSETESTTVTVENSLTGEYWATAVDENGEDITGTLTAGTTPLIINISNASPGMKFRLSFAANSGNIIVTVK